MSSTDISLIYVGPITRHGYLKLSDLLEEQASSDKKQKEGYLTIISLGKDIDAAYRIARAMGHHYPDGWTLFIPYLCKSAATLIAIGANQLVISDRGELGPLDVQLSNKQELFERSSGLAINAALDSSDKRANNLFENILMSLRNAGLGTEIAARVASDMACGFVSPIIKQIDPIEYGEYNRALTITLEYGARLREKFRNIDFESIAKLTYAYNSHSFVIDKKEATTLFKRVKSPDEGEKQLEKKIRERTNDFNNFPSTPLIESFPLCHKTTSMNQENS